MHREKERETDRQTERQTREKEKRGEEKERQRQTHRQTEYRKTHRNRWSTKILFATLRTWLYLVADSSFSSLRNPSWTVQGAETLLK